MRIGPEPTTDNFHVIEYADEEGKIPGTSTPLITGPRTHNAAATFKLYLPLQHTFIFIFLPPGTMLELNHQYEKFNLQEMCYLSIRRSLFVTCSSLEELFSAGSSPPSLTRRL